MVKNNKQRKQESDQSEYCAYLEAFVNTSTNQHTDCQMGSGVPRTMAARALGAMDAMNARLDSEARLRTFDDFLDAIEEMCRLRSSFMESP